MAFNIKYVIEAIDKFSPSIKKATDAASKAQKQAAQAAQSQKKAMMKPMEAVQQASIMAGSALALAFPIKKAMQFEDAMADVKKVVDFKDSIKGPEKLAADLKRLSRTIPINVEGLAAMAAAGGEFGLAEKDIIGFVEQSAKMAVAFDMVPEEAGQAMSKLSNVLNIPIDKIGEMGDIINYLGNNTNANARKITEATILFAAMGKSAGFNNAQIAALTTTVIEFGREPEVAATALNSIVSRLQTIQFTSPAVQKMFNKTGLSAKKFGVMMKKDAGGALQELLKNMKGMDSTDRAGMIQAIFGAGVDAQVLEQLVSGSDRIQKNFAMVGDKAKYAGSMQKEFEARSKTTSNSLRLAKNAISEVAINLGTLLLPTIVSVLQAFSKATREIAKFSEKYPALTKLIVMATTSLLGFIVATKAMNLMKAIGGLETLRAGFIKLNMAMRANIVLAIASAILYLISQTEDGKKVFAAFGELFGATFMAMGNLIDFVVGGIKALTAEGTILGDVLSPIFKFITHQVDNMVKAFKAAVDAMASLGLISQDQVLEMRMTTEQKDAREAMRAAGAKSSEDKMAAFLARNPSLATPAAENLGAVPANVAALQPTIAKPNMIGVENNNKIEVSLRATAGTEVAGVKSNLAAGTTVKLGKGGGQNMPAAAY